MQAQFFVNDQVLANGLNTLETIINNPHVELVAVKAHNGYFYFKTRPVNIIDAQFTINKKEEENK